MKSNKFDNICLIIPAYNPDDNLLALVQKSLLNDFLHIIIVDDGSNNLTRPVFEKAYISENISIISHECNKGKGEALKTGFNYYLKNFSEKSIGVVTVDADGQHSIESIIAVSNALDNYPDELILGVRSFSADTPFRSRIGNNITRSLLNFFYGINLKDTQTGLRGIPNPLIYHFINLEYSRYEFEMKCLIMTKELQYDFNQIDIETIYINKNKNSNFNPIIDSIKIYYVLFRFIFCSIFCFLLDIFIFTIAYKISKDIFLSTYFSRTISGYTNFYINKYSVFKKHGKENYKKEFLFYIVLAIITASISAFLVKSIILFNSNLIATKIIVDFCLFTLSFFVQKNLIFSKSE